MPVQAPGTRGFVIKDPFVEIDGVDVSSTVRAVRVQMSAPDVNATASGADGTERVQGIRDDQFGLRVKQTTGAQALDATLFPLFDSGEEFEVRVRRNSTAVSATNPEYRGVCILTGEYTPLDGEIGALAESEVTLPVQGKITKHTVAGS